ncbi:hypothetical protein CGCTS75_v002422 [Colletotrichum tropicale]|nr:hypothetical protein CGCTS75_v002422 [Colletotrichum tropicale]
MAHTTGGLSRPAARAIPPTCSTRTSARRPRRVTTFAMLTTPLSQLRMKRLTMPLRSTAPSTTGVCRMAVWTAASVVLTADSRLASSRATTSLRMCLCAIKALQGLEMGRNGL